MVIGTLNQFRYTHNVLIEISQLNCSDQIPRKMWNFFLGIYHEKTTWLTLLLPIFDYFHQKKYLDGENIILFTGLHFVMIINVYCQWNLVYINVKN